MKLLFADDERSLQELMRVELTRMGHEVTVCPDGETAVAALEKNTYDCIIVDLDMPGLTGIEVMGRCKAMNPDTEAVILTGKSTVESAVAALRHGAFDYLTKPITLVDLRSLLNRIEEKRELTNKYRAAIHRLDCFEGLPRLIGKSDSMEQVRNLIEKVAPTPSTVLILGETGSGKELVARALHDTSPRADAPFVAINCGALPETLIESELFGHRKGAFTGADEHRIGLCEVASGGTLFLDEIGELPKAMQAKLLRVLEGGEIRPVGDNESRQVDVRFVCATNRDLEQMVDEGEFREDLLFRVNTFEIRIAPLRERTDDIPQLATHLFHRFCKTATSDDAIFSVDAMQSLCDHVWPGNVRELANVIEHATILCDEVPILPEHLPRRFGQRGLSSQALRAIGPRSLRDLELQAIHESLERHDNSKPKAAEELGISLKTLYNKINAATTVGKSA